MNHHRKLVYAFLQRSKINRRPITDSPPMMSKYTTIVSAICFQFIAINVLILHVFCLLIQHFFIHNSEKNYESFAIHAMCNLTAFVCSTPAYSQYAKIKSGIIAVVQSTFNKKLIHLFSPIFCFVTHNKDRFPRKNRK